MAKVKTPADVFSRSESATIQVALAFFRRQRFDHPHLELSHFFDNAQTLSNLEIDRLGNCVGRMEDSSRG